jgi:hypothetical protein
LLVRFSILVFDQPLRPLNPQAALPILENKWKPMRGLESLLSVRLSAVCGGG